MRTPQASSVFCSLTLLAAIALATNPVSAGPPQITAAQLATLQPVDPTAPPEPGNYWLLVGPNPEMPSPPYPFPPPVSKLPNVITYRLDDWHYVVDDSQVDYQEFRARQALDAAITDLEVHGLARPMGLDVDGGGIQPMDLESNPTNSLLLSISQFTNGQAPLTIYGTSPESLYEIQSRLALTNAGWVSEGSVLGAVNQDWTATVVPEGDRTNLLFFRARSWGGGDDYGTPWAWYVEQGLNPLTPGIGGQDSNGDGLANYQEYLRGSDPRGQNGFSVWVSSPAGNHGVP